MMKKTNIIKALTAISTAAVLSAMSVPYAFADSYPTPKTEEFRNDGDYTTFAAPTDSSKGGATSRGDVNILIGDTLPENYYDSEAVYRVTLDWTSLNFSYGGTWDPDEHVYTGGTWKIVNGTGETPGNTGTITVTNHSNWGISYSTKFNTADDVTATKNNVTATLTNYNGTLDYCPIGGPAPDNSASEITVTVNLADDTTGVESETDFTLDTVVVKIEAADNKTST